ncbi:hypothetical protein N7931_15710 [Catenovulum sp. 2E275]|uniref:CC0125/CC1285 family lipoprotein n=1 Tax=Catenovulum sp. 2E275 TaxID=2980497 RepID=UPI0021D2C978|nr:hypothetical protein [Catenovulum sp. 2E275]MCU4677080.1 hypothetical protein [Catenovulum sp. 2E275]
MKNCIFKPISMLVLFTLILAGCASAPKYKQAQGNGYGYSESKITSDKYRVSFKTRGDDKLMVMDFALLRAAELTKQQGYDWFVVVSRDTLIDQKSVQPRSSVGVSAGRDVYQSCGALGCQTRSRPSTGVGIGLNFGDTDSEIQSIIEINLGKGVRPENLDSYPADELITNIKSSYQLE